MNDSTVKLSAGEILSNGVSLGLKNFVPIFLIFILYVITIWIPYLNVGTTIALQDLVPKLSRGEKIDPTYIFDGSYRKDFGEFFLLFGLYTIGIYAALMLMIAPGIVLYFAWMFALPLFVDRNTGPIESLRLSNRMTYGNKLPIFLALLVFFVIIFVVQTVLGLVLDDGDEPNVLASLLSFVITLLTFPMIYGIMAYCYGRLLSGLESGSTSDYAEPVPAL